jgi:hypothetical protein
MIYTLFLTPRRKFMIVSTSMIKIFKNGIVLLILAFLLCNCSNEEQINFSTAYFKIQIDKKGFIASMKNISKNTNREFCPSDKPSPLLCLFDSKSNDILEPIGANYNKAENILLLTFANNSVAKILIETKEKYFKFTLLSLSARDNINEIQ